MIATDLRGRIGFGLVLWMLVTSLEARAELAVTGSRFVYLQEDKRISIPVRTVGTAPILLQAWLDDGHDVGPEGAAVPFFLTPPVLRLEPDRTERLELRHSGEPLPEDRESLFWINLLEIPSSQVDAVNLLRLSYRLRMKLLYRPAALPGSSRDAVLQVRWTAMPATHGAEARLSVENPSAFYVSYSAVLLQGRAQAVDLGQVTLAPRSVLVVGVPAAIDPDSDDLSVQYEAVVDAGKYLTGKAEVARSVAGLERGPIDETGDSRQ